MEFKSKSSLNDSTGSLDVYIEGKQFISLELEELQYDSLIYQDNLSEEIKTAIHNAFIAGCAYCKEEIELKLKEL